LHPKEDASEVDGDDPVEVLEGAVGQLAVDLTDDAGIVDEDIEAASRVHGRIDHGLDLCRLGDVHPAEHGCAALLPDYVDRFLAGPFVDLGGEHPCALRRVLLRNGPAHPGTAPGHDLCLAVEYSHLTMLPLPEMAGGSPHSIQRGERPGACCAPSRATSSRSENRRCPEPGSSVLSGVMIRSLHDKHPK